MVDRDRSPAINVPAKPPFIFAGRDGSGLGTLAGLFLTVEDDAFLVRFDTALWLKLLIDSNGIMRKKESSSPQIKMELPSVTEQTERSDGPRLTGRATPAVFDSACGHQLI
jgi:hypothetical protein